MWRGGLGRAKANPLMRLLGMNIQVCCLRSADERVKAGNLLLERLVHDMLEQPYRLSQRRIHRVFMYVFPIKNVYERAFIFFGYPYGISNCVPYGMLCVRDRNSVKKSLVGFKLDR